MRIELAGLCAALAAAGSAGAAPEAKPAGTAADEKAIGKLGADWTEAWNRHDAEGMASVFSERGDVINPMGAVAKGRPQIFKLFQGEQAGALKQSKMATTCEPPRFLAAGVAEVDCDFTLEGAIGPQAPAALHGHSTQIAVRDGERWSIASLRAMVPRPTAPPDKVEAPASTTK